ncbi:cupin domain-containing protein [Chitinophaga pendula]|uniref:cupin domain-containing protein n=1 Tax=Chitinophaga TaxID=79328 RepID=UPI000BAF94A5|nr:MULTISPECIES: cupin domain-containing protein [Chitinophaga]ASZ11793.1 hypothetical protein CK934_12910 [Chitinophaga sp. MD30]UCJ05187.1 cupin domain-containing protein [Chitinophaga pendula]
MGQAIYTAQYWREQLSLTHHVEGGAFRETYRSSLILPKTALPAAIKGDRNAATAIYFLLEHGEFSAFHRIAADEIWHCYDGQRLYIYEIEQDGSLTKHMLGKNIQQGENLQVVIKAGNWFASRIETPGTFALVGCTVAPGFDFEDFELADRNTLQTQYPQHANLIGELTR